MCSKGFSVSVKGSELSAQRGPLRVALKGSIGLSQRGLQGITRIL